MSFMESIQTCFSKYVTFSGRARRSEYWYFALFTGVISSILNAVGKNVEAFAIIGGIFGLAVLLPSLAVCVRRLHDINKSGWWILISLVPIVGAILLIIWYCKDSDPGENNFGPNPKA